MKKKLLFFFIILGYLIFILNKTFIPKYYDYDYQITINQFYKLKKKTIDIISFGNSRVALGFSPIELNKRYNIRSYNLGMRSQNPLISYYWLCESLRFQSPKLIICDFGDIFTPNKNRAYYEELYLGTFLPMKLSLNKIRGIKDIISIEKRLTFTDFIFNLNRYHNNFKNLTWQNFFFSFSNNKLFGQEVYYSKGNFDYFGMDFTNENSIFFDDKTVNLQMYEYCKKIIQKCKEENIDLLVIMTPIKNYNNKKHLIIQDLCLKNDVSFIDFNDSKILKEIKFNSRNDMGDEVHLNYSGSEKITKYLGNYLISNYKVIQSIDNRDYRGSYSYFEQINENTRLKECNDLPKYLDILNNNRYIVLFSYKNTGNVLAKNNFTSKLNEFGLKNLNNLDYAYIAIKNGPQITEKTSLENSVSFSGFIKFGLKYSIISTAAVDGAIISIKINNMEFSRNQKGLNVVVYDKEHDCLIDSISFNLSDGIGNRFRNSDVFFQGRRYFK